MYPNKEHKRLTSWRSVNKFNMLRPCLTFVSNRQFWHESANKRLLTIIRSVCAGNTSAEQRCWWFVYKSDNAFSSLSLNWSTKSQGGGGGYEIPIGQLITGPHSLRSVSGSNHYYFIIYLFIITSLSSTGWLNERWCFLFILLPWVSNHELGPAVIRPNNGGGVFNMQNAGNSVFSGVLLGNYFNKALKNVVYCSVLIALPLCLYRWNGACKSGNFQWIYFRKWKQSRRYGVWTVIHRG